MPDRPTASRPRAPRTPPNPLLTALVGGVVALSLVATTDAEGAVVLLGAATGVLWALWQRDARVVEDLGERLERLEAFVLQTARSERPAPTALPDTERTALEAPLRDVPGPEAPLREVPIPEASVPREPRPEAPVPDSALPEAPRPPLQRRHSEDAEPIRRAPEPRPPAEPDAVTLALQRAWAFVTGSNPLALVGLLIFFVGIGVGIRWAAENGVFPIQVRLIAAAVAGLALGVVGWRLRGKSPAFGLTLQGGGVAVLYLTVYAASALYGLIPAGLAVGLMAVVAVICGALALAQDAPILAVLGVAGGFAAPILAGTNAGSHVLLLGYYALLNVGVLGVSWVRAWRSVAVVGFVSTFVTGGLWGGLAYRPELYASVQPFLILSFAIYFALAVRFAVRSAARGLAPERALAVDGALVFGLPAATLVLQSALVEGLPYGRAWSAAALAAVYLGAWAVVLRRPGLRLLADAFLAVGLVFATLALPLAFARVVFGALWVLEGAALVWVGARQHKAWMRAAGLALQVAAAGVLFMDGVVDLDRAFSPETLTGWLVAVALGLSAYVLRRWSASVAPWERVAGPVALGFGLLWWAATATTHVVRLLPNDYVHVGLVGASAASAVLFLGLGRALSWPGLRAASLLVVPAGLLLWIGLLLDGVAPHAHAGWAAWPALIAAAVLSVRDSARNESALEWRRPSFAGLVWLATGVGALEVSALLPAGGGWDAAAAGLGLAAAGLLVQHVREAAPGERTLAVGGLVAAAAVWSVAVPLLTAGRTPPLPAIPLLNALDVATVAVVVALLLSVRSLSETARQAVWIVAGGSALVGLAAIVARAAHAPGGVPYDADALWGSVRFQAPLAVVWTLLALSLTVAAVRRQSRPLWFFGVGVLALVVAKLFTVDLAQARALEIVAAFVVVGLLVLVVGYRSPLPPKRADADEPLEAPREAPFDAEPEGGTRDPGAA